jgi:hypothetical protein
VYSQAGERACGQLRDSRPAAGCLPIEQLLDPAQRAAKGLRVGARPAQRQRGLKLGGYRVGRAISPRRDEKCPGSATSFVDLPEILSFAAFHCFRVRCRLFAAIAASCCCFVLRRARAFTGVTALSAILD